MWQNTSESDSGADKRVEFFVAANCELEMAWRDALDLQVLGGIASKLENLSGKVLQDGGKVNTGFGADARLLARDGTKVTLYATAGELQGRRVISALSS